MLQRDTYREYKIPLLLPTVALVSSPLIRKHISFVLGGIFLFYVYLQAKRRRAYI